MKQVIVFPRGQLSAKDKERLSKAGVVAVEADAPRDVVMLLPSSSLATGDDLLMSAMAGVTCQTYGHRTEHMMYELHKRLKAREAERTTEQKD